MSGLEVFSNFVKMRGAKNKNAYRNSCKFPDHQNRLSGRTCTYISFLRYIWNKLLRNSTLIDFHNDTLFNVFLGFWYNSSCCSRLSIWSVFLTEKSFHRRVLSNFLLIQNGHYWRLWEMSFFSLPASGTLGTFWTLVNPIVNMFLELNSGI